MEISLTTQFEYLLRIVIAALCGAAIGYERESRMKTAGIRTHLIVSLAASLMMVISKYGFYDVLTKAGISLDPSRIAAGVVTAIGFLGAGVIFVRKMNVSGLTTAAGVWATVGVGMAIGAGLYFIGIITTGILLLVQIILHKNSRLVKSTVTEQITLRVNSKDASMSPINQRLTDRNIEVLGAKIKKEDSGMLEIKLFVRLPDTYEITDVLNLLEEDPSILSIEF